MVVRRAIIAAQCGRGCITASNYSSAQVQVFPAMKTGRVNLITNAMARELITDSEGKVTAVSYIDKATRTERQVKCRAVVLAASCCESARLMLNSKGSGPFERVGKFVGGGGSISHGQHRVRAGRIDSGAARAATLQFRRHGRRAPVYAVVAVGQEDRFPARLSHRNRRRIRDAGDREFCGARESRRRLRRRAQEEDL